jgi:hypothetical protein
VLHIFGFLMELFPYLQEQRTQQCRSLKINATAAPLSRQFTSIPGFTQIGEPVGFCQNDVMCVNFTSTV